MMRKICFRGVGGGGGGLGGARVLSFEKISGRVRIHLSKGLLQ